MKQAEGFCIRQMRREYRGALKSCWGTAVLLLLISAFFGAVLMSKHVEKRSVLLFLGIFFVLIAALFALYLILSDEKRLIRQTPFGQELLALGEPEKIMSEIDQSARAFYEPHGKFTLLKDWMIVEYPCWWRWEPYRQCARPIPRQAIKGIRFLNDENPDDPEERHIQVLTDHDPVDLYLFQEQDAEALKAWMKEGIQYDEA